MSINNKILDIIWEPQITRGTKPIDPKEGDIYYDGKYNYIFGSNKWNKFKVKLNPTKRRINKIKNLYELR